MLTAVDRDIGPRHEGRLVGREVGDEAGDFFGLAEAAHRNVRKNLAFKDFLRNGEDHLGADIARGDGVDRHAGDG